MESSPTVAPDDPTTDRSPSQSVLSQDDDRVEGESPTITQQTAFDVDTGEIEPTKETAETSLDQFGVTVESPLRESKIAEAQASSLLKDDRPEEAIASSTETDDTEQADLFPDGSDGQQTLTGETATQCLFGDSLSSKECEDKSEPS